MIVISNPHERVPRAVDEYNQKETFLQFDITIFHRGQFNDCL